MPEEKVPCVLLCSKTPMGGNSKVVSVIGQEV